MFDGNNNSKSLMLWIKKKVIKSINSIEGNKLDFFFSWGYVLLMICKRIVVSDYQKNIREKKRKKSEKQSWLER